MLASDVTQALQQLSVELHGVCSVCLQLPRLFRPLSCGSRGAHWFAELDLGSEVQRLAGPLPPLQFHRDFVSKNKPCVLTGSGFPAVVHYIFSVAAEIEASIVTSACRGHRELACFVQMEPTVFQRQAS